MLRTSKYEVRKPKILFYTSVLQPFPRFVMRLSIDANIYPYADGIYNNGISLFSSFLSLKDFSNQRMIKSHTHFKSSITKYL